MLYNILVSSYIGNRNLTPTQISEYIHKSFSAFSNVTNIDTSVSSMGIQTTFSKSGGYEVMIPKKNPSVEMTISHYRNHVKPILQNALFSIKSNYEKEFIELQNRIFMELEKSRFHCCRADSTQDDYIYFNLIYENLKLEYQTYAQSHYHFLYSLGVTGFKDVGTYLIIRIVPVSFPCISY